MDKYESALQEYERVISTSSNPIDLGHAANTLQWLIWLSPSASEVIKLSAYAHDIERASPSRVSKNDFGDYNEYKKIHAKRGGEIAAKIAEQSGYSQEDATRIGSIIEQAEFMNDDPDVQLICDADSISFFDHNLEHYLAVNGPDKTVEKINFMYNRASNKAQEIIRELLIKKPELDLAGIAQ